MKKKLVILGLLAFAVAFIAVFILPDVNEQRATTVSVTQAESVGDIVADEPEVQPPEEVAPKVMAVVAETSPQPQVAPPSIGDFIEANLPQLPESLRPYAEVITSFEASLLAHHEQMAALIPGPEITLVMELPDGTNSPLESGELPGGEVWRQTRRERAAIVRANGPAIKALQQKLDQTVAEFRSSLGQEALAAYDQYKVSQMEVLQTAMNIQKQVEAEPSPGEWQALPANR